MTDDNWGKPPALFVMYHRSSVISGWL